MTAQYRQHNSTQTLQKGLEELRALEAAQQNDASETFDAALQTELTQHDVIHVLFGCGTDLQGEIQAHVWTLFGTTLSMQQMHQVNTHKDHKSALQEIGHFKLLRTWLRLFPQLLRTIWRAKHMSKKFPIEQTDAYLQRSLKEIRREFSIYF
jgi:hypothetical protein